MLPKIQITESGWYLFLTPDEKPTQPHERLQLWRWCGLANLENYGITTALMNGIGGTTTVMF